MCTPPRRHKSCPGLPPPVQTRVTMCAPAPLAFPNHSCCASLVPRCAGPRSPKQRNEGLSSERKLTAASNFNLFERRESRGFFESRQTKVQSRSRRVSPHRMSAPPPSSHQPSNQPNTHHTQSIPHQTHSSRISVFEKKNSQIPFARSRWTSGEDMENLVNPFVRVTYFR